MKRYMTATEASQTLGVSRATLYSYVSRGLIRSEPMADGTRRHRYHGEDIQRLVRRKAQRREPTIAAEQALHFGAPVLKSSLTFIDGQSLYYRGENALNLAGSRDVEEVAWFLWTGDWEGATFDLASPNAHRVTDQTAEMTMVERYQCALPRLEANDMAAFDLRPQAVQAAGARILTQLASLTAGGPYDINIVETLLVGWEVDIPGAERLLSAALILCADHELNVSSFTARCVASAGSTPYQVVLAGLAALQGSKHGGHTSRVATLLDEVREPQRARQVIKERLRRSESIPGFGHPLYDTGDPRARLLLQLMGDCAPDDPSIIMAQTVTREVRGLVDLRPNIDFALVVLSRLFSLPRDGGLTLFALGRTIGWIAHALEQYGLDQMIRPRARYDGPLPKDAGEGMVAP